MYLQILACVYVMVQSVLFDLPPALILSTLEFLACEDFAKLESAAARHAHSDQLKELYPLSILKPDLLDSSLSLLSWAARKQMHCSVFEMKSDEVRQVLNTKELMDVLQNSTITVSATKDLIKTLRCKSVSLSLPYLDKPMVLTVLRSLVENANIIEKCIDITPLFIPKEEVKLLSELIVNNPQCRNMISSFKLYFQCSPALTVEESVGPFLQLKRFYLCSVYVFPTDSYTWLSQLLSLAPNLEVYQSDQGTCSEVLICISSRLRLLDLHFPHRLTDFLEILPYCPFRTHLEELWLSNIKELLYEKKLFQNLVELPKLKILELNNIECEESVLASVSTSLTNWC